MWVGASGRGSLTTEQMSVLLDAVSTWHEDVVRALRAIRVRMKGGIGNAPSQLSEFASVNEYKRLKLIANMLNSLC